MQKKSQLTGNRLVLIDAFVLLSIGVYFLSLRYVAIPDLVFHGLYFSSLVLTGLVVLRSKSDRSRLGTILLWALTFKLALVLRSDQGTVVLSPNSLGQFALADAISSSGSVMLGMQGPYESYSYWPLMQTFFSSLHMISAIPLVPLVNYAMSFLSLLVLVFSFALYKRIVGCHASASLFLLAACPFFVYLESFATQQAFATIFLTMLLLSLAREPRRWQWTLVMICSAAAISVSHTLLPLILIIFLVLAALQTVVTRQPILGLVRESVRATLTLSCMVVTWFVFVGAWYCNNLAHWIWIYLVSISEAAPQNALYAFGVAAPEWKPIWILVLEYVGLLVYAAAVFMRLLQLIALDRQARVRRIVPLAVSGCVIAAIFAVVLWLGPVRTSPDLKWRSMTLFYLSTSPIFADGLFKLRDAHSQVRMNVKPHTLRIKASSRSVLPLLLLVLVATPSFYMFYPPETYNASTPPSGGIDLRLPNAEWVAAALFLKHSVVQKENVYGTVKAALLVAAYNNLIIRSPILPLPPGSMLIGTWRLSTNPERSLAYHDFVRQLAVCNLYYSNGEVDFLSTAGAH